MSLTRVYYKYKYWYYNKNGLVLSYNIKADWVHLEQKFMKNKTSLATNRSNNASNLLRFFIDRLSLPLTDSVPWYGVCYILSEQKILAFVFQLCNFYLFVLLLSFNEMILGILYLLQLLIEILFLFVIIGLSWKKDQPQIDET